MPKKTEKDSFRKFIDLVKRLRKECPWDREQTHSSIRSSLIEESYEVVEAVDHNDNAELKEELGDVLLNVVMHTVIAEENRTFDIEDVIASISEKMIRRHPHVFSKTIVKNAGEVKKNWEHIKLTEGKKSVIDGVPKKMPALLMAQRVQEKASKVGFDWDKKQKVWKKVIEEIREFTDAERSKKQVRIEEEFGDLLFALVNYSRFIGINAEFALKDATAKFIKRFNLIEDELSRRGRQIGTTSLKEMDEIWNANKKSEK